MIIQAQSLGMILQQHKPLKTFDRQSVVRSLQNNILRKFYHTVPFQQASVRGMLFSLPEGTLTCALLSRINLATE